MNGQVGRMRALEGASMGKDGLGKAMGPGNEKGVRMCTKAKNEHLGAHVLGRRPNWGRGGGVWSAWPRGGANVLENTARYVVTRYKTVQVEAVGLILTGYCGCP